MNEEHPHATLSQTEITELKKRAQQLAHAEAQANNISTNQASDSYLVFKLLNEDLAVPLSHVTEVISLHQVISIPGAPLHVAGITRLRGKILTLVNLRSYWQEAIKGNADNDRALVIDYQDISFGILCTKIDGLHTFIADQINPAPENLPPKLQKSLLGVADKSILIIDIPAMLNTPGFIVNQ